MLAITNNQPVEVRQLQMISDNLQAMVWQYLKVTYCWSGDHCWLTNSSLPMIGSDIFVSFSSSSGFGTNQFQWKALIEKLILDSFLSINESSWVNKIFLSFLFLLLPIHFVSRPLANHQPLVRPHWWIHSSKQVFPIFPFPSSPIYFVSWPLANQVNMGSHQWLS